MSNAFAALIWWVVPITGLLGGIGYVIWISKFKGKFESETNRSVGQFERFQKAFSKEKPDLSGFDQSNSHQFKRTSSDEEPPTFTNP